jgi:hypothetical protein
LVLAVIGAAFGTLLMPFTRRPDHPTTRRPLAHLGAVNLAAVALAADAEQRTATATICQSMIVQAPAPNDKFLALIGKLRNDPFTFARPRDEEGREGWSSRPSALLPSAFQDLLHGPPRAQFSVSANSGRDFYGIRRPVTGPRRFDS